MNKKIVLQYLREWFLEPKILDFFLVDQDKNKLQIVADQDSFTIRKIKDRRFEV